MPMNTYAVGLAIAICLLVWPGRSDAQEPNDSPQTEAARALVTSATALAGSDLARESEKACWARGFARDPQARPSPLVEPLAIFDNLYFIGFEEIGTWVLRTSDGLVLFDTLNTPLEAEQILEPGMRQLGLDPANIKYIVVSHGHRDHFGGASYFQQKYGTRVMMAAADWDYMEERYAQGTGRGTDQPLPTRDMEIADGQELTVGDATIKFGIYPGHTPGSIMFSIPVIDRGTRRVALVPGGALVVPDRASYASFEHVINDYFKPLKPEILFTTHPMTASNGLAQMEQIRNNPSGQNPYVYSQERMARYLDILLLCRKAWVVEAEGPF